MYEDFMSVTHNHKFPIDMEIVDLRVKGMSPFITREGICLLDNKILVVYPKNDVIYGTPGGGIDPGESKEDALRRELKEEVGADEIDIISYLGTMTAKRMNLGGVGVYKPIHHYYLVSIGKSSKQKLITYEEELELQYDYIDLDDVISHNQSVIHNRENDYLDFYTNQTEIFKELKKILHIKKRTN